MLLSDSQIKELLACEKLICDKLQNSLDAMPVPHHGSSRGPDVIVFSLNSHNYAVQTKHGDVTPSSIHHCARSTGKSSPRSRPTSVARCAVPQVIGSASGGDGGSGGGGGSDDGGGGEDGDGGDGEPPSRRLWHFITSLLLYLFLGITWPIRSLPDLVTLMRWFDEVFPPEIHDKLYAPQKSRLLRDICNARDAEWDQPLGRRAWTWFWRRVKFWCLVAKCFRKWSRGLLPEWWKKLNDD